MPCVKTLTRLFLFCLLASALLLTRILAHAVAAPRTLPAQNRATTQNSAATQNNTAGVALFDGTTLKGWNGNPALWSVKDGAIHGISSTGSQLLLTDGDYTDFRLILKSRLLSNDNHLGVCFWGDRTPDFSYGNCILVIPPTGHFWDYHPGMSDDPQYEKFPHADFDPHVWHDTEILAHLKSGTVRVAVNGIEVTRYTDPDPPRLKKGPIGLQLHSGASEVEYKDLQIEVDPQIDRLLTVKTPAAE